MHLTKTSSLIYIGAYLGTGAQAGYTPHKAVQINFYNNDVCTNYAGEMAFWHESQSPLAGTKGQYSGGTGGDCWNFKQPNGAKSLNVADCWTSDGTEWPNEWCECDFWDDWGCKGETTWSGGNCLASRSPDGWQWKSARCYVLSAAPITDSHGP